MDITVCAVDGGSPESFMEQIRAIPHVDVVIGEKGVNLLLATITGLDFDFTYGPRILSTEIIKHLKKLPDDIGWGWLSAAVVIAQKLKREIFAVTMDLPCPGDQRAETPKDEKCRRPQAQNHRNAIDLVKDL